MTSRSGDVGQEVKKFGARTGGDRAALLRRIADVEAWAARHRMLRHPGLTPSLEEFPRLEELAPAIERLAARRVALLGGPVGVDDPADALFAWVPTPFGERAQAGIDANPYECLYWLPDFPDVLTS